MRLRITRSSLNVEIDKPFGLPLASTMGTKGSRRPLASYESGGKRRSRLGLLGHATGAAWPRRRRRGAGAGAPRPAADSAARRRRSRSQEREGEPACRRATRRAGATARRSSCASGGPAAGWRAAAAGAGSAGAGRRALGPEQIGGQRQLRPQGAGRTLDAGEAKVAEVHDPGNARRPGRRSSRADGRCPRRSPRSESRSRVLVLAPAWGEERHRQPGLQREVGDLAVQPRDFPLRRQPLLGQVEPLRKASACARKVRRPASSTRAFATSACSTSFCCRSASRSALFGETMK